MRSLVILSGDHLRTIFYREGGSIDALSSQAEEHRPSLEEINNALRSQLSKHDEQLVHALRLSEESLHKVLQVQDRMLEAQETAIKALEDNNKFMDTIMELVKKNELLHAEIDNCRKQLDMKMKRQIIIFD